MYETQYFFDILWFLFAAVIVSAMSARLKSSPVLGYLIAGVIMGPWALDLIAHVENSRSVAELGLVFLFFAIGLGMSFQRLKILRKYLFGFGSLQVLITTAVLTAALMLFNLPLMVSIILASSLALSSTAIVLQLLSESNEMSTKHGRVTFSILLLQDLAAIMLLVWVDFLRPDPGAEHVMDVMSVGVNLLQSIFGLVLMVVIGRFVVRPTFRFLGDTYQADLFMAFTLLVILGTSALAQKVGVSIEFAAFTIGLLLSDSEFRNKVENVIRSFRGLLLGLFFMGIGMSISVNMLWQYLGPILMLTAIFIPLKFVIVYILSRSFHLSHWVAVRVSTYIAPGGEFAFVLLGPAIMYQLIPSDLGNIAILTAAISMMLTPLLDKLVRKMVPADDEQDEVLEEDIL